MSDDQNDNESRGKVIPFPVTFKPDTDDDAAPEMRRSDEVRDDRCLHRKTTFDRRARVVTCGSCGVDVDVFAVLEDVVAWIRRNEWRYEEMARAARIDRLAERSRLIRVVQGKQSLLIGRTWVSGFHAGPQAIPTEMIALGDYVSSNRLYRARREAEGWTVKFYDPAHGLKDIKHIERPTLTQVREAVRKHWLWLNNNAHAAGFA